MKDKDVEQMKLKISHDLKLRGEAWMPVSFVAFAYGVSARRIRALLAAGRLDGRQRDNGYWEVSYPPRLLLGRRGPQLRFLREQAPKKPVLKLV